MVRRRNRSGFRTIPGKQNRYAVHFLVSEHVVPLYMTARWVGRCSEWGLVTKDDFGVVPLA
jgi:hypothetical protein